MLYLRYLRDLLAAQDDPRAAILLEGLAEPTDDRNPDWTLHAYLLDRLSEIPAFTAAPTDTADRARGLVYPIEHWLAWQYHGGRACGKDEPKFASPADKAAFLDAIAAIVTELETSEGLARASRWYIERARARVRMFEARGATCRPSETAAHAELRHAAFLAEKRDQLARLEASPTFPGYERQALALAN